MNSLDFALFGIYPYICMAVFLLGSLLRFDRDQYSWKSDSSQMLRAGTLRWGSNLFHIGVLFLFFGHLVGMLTPHFMYEHFISAGSKQLMAMVSGGLAGLLGFVGVTLLLHRRLVDERIRINSKTSDIVLLVLLWLQLALGLATIPLSAQHLDGGMMMSMAHPIHLHGQQFQVISRTIGMGEEESYGTVKDGLMSSGYKDTVLVMPGERVRLIKPFNDFKGVFMYHCHNLEHEDMGMMREFEVY